VRDALLYWLAIPAAVIFSGLLLDEVFGLAALPASRWLTAVAVLLVVAGAALIRQAIRDFARYGRGTPNPRRPPVVLVNRGIYRRCRHPMFFGYDLAALGVVCLLRSPAMLCVSFPLFLFLQVGFLRKEEQYLRRRYGAAYAHYQQQVPFLVPWGRGGEQDNAVHKIF
jgi:protein-S-isoprenylcysteine O-methyltransferase Ste14